jgi:hypothetical protein
MTGHYLISHCTVQRTISKSTTMSKWVYLQLCVVLQSEVTINDHEHSQTKVMHRSIQNIDHKSL